MLVKENHETKVLFTDDRDPLDYAALIREPNEQVIPERGFWKVAGIAIGSFCRLYQNGTGRVTFVVSRTSHPLVVSN